MVGRLLCGFAEVTPTYTFSRGETIILALNLISGGVLGDVTAIEAVVRRFGIGAVTLDPAQPIDASFTVATRSPVGLDLGGWTLEISPTVSEALAPGLYLADARLTLVSREMITSSVIIEVREAAVSWN